MPTSPISKIAFWLSLTAVLVAAVLVVTWVDLTPQVASDFFFSTDDPQFQASQQIADTFPSGAQLLVRAVGPDIFSPDYLDALRQLSDDLAAMDGVTSVQSLTHGPAKPQQVPDSPIWSRLLLGNATNASQLIVFIDAEGDSERQLIRDVEALLAVRSVPSFALDISGVPYVVELIRRHLQQDLRTFSLASLVVFGLLIAIIYRSWRIVVGTLVTCLGACAVTLTLLQLLGKPIGLLTANIVTIVFVLTLSHIVFLTANWRLESRRSSAEDRDGDSVQRAVGRTLNASFWCMVTTLLGFASLLLANAKPLRELGFSGALGAAVAIVIAYGLYPAWLRGMPAVQSKRPTPTFPWNPGKLTFVGLAVLLVVFAVGLPRIDTDPSLLSYFGSDSELWSGLEMIDRSGGSSPLLFVVTPPDDSNFEQRSSLDALAAVQAEMDKDPAIGTALTLSVLVDEARRNPLAGLLPLGGLYNILDSPQYNGVLGSFLSQDRRQALVFLRMHEVENEEPRREVIERLQQAIASQGLDLHLTGGLFELQAQLGELVASSLLRGLGGLFALFLVIAAIVSRRATTTFAMVLALLPIPILLLGGFGLLGQPVDIISSPAANVAIALGIDSMIHLVTAVRRRRLAGDAAKAAWDVARNQLWQPIVGAMLILATGFGIFSLSSFPPTQRFGSAVAFGTLAAACMALVLLPALARGLDREA